MVLSNFIYVLLALACAIMISFTMTPIARVSAFKLGAVSVPKDNRRMHTKAMPLMGGLAIYVAFTVTALAFSELTKTTVGLLLGGTIIVATGMIDDIYNLKAYYKLGMQIVAAVIPVLFGVRIEYIHIFGTYIHFGIFSVLVTVVWIVILTNAMNLIDGLDGLSCGISAISAVTLLITSFFVGQTAFSTILLLAVLAGSCIGFLPFNLNPAKIFMGDTGSMFLGYVLSTIAVFGVFKVNALFAFAVPFLSFAIPIFDTLFAFCRRVCHGQNPFKADRGHIHHKLIDMGFNQKQSVTILYAISAIFGISAVLLAINRPAGAITVIVFAMAILFFNWVFITKDSKTREYTGLKFKRSIKEAVPAKDIPAVEEVSAKASEDEEKTA